jgi:PAS domain S-box-containing protein
MRNSRVLVVDDEEIIRVGCQRILSDMNLQAEGAENGRIGLERIRENQYDLVLLDLIMPELDGMKLLEKLQAHDPDIVTIIVTGFATIESAVEAMTKGAYDYLPKPFTPEEFRVKVNRGLEKRRLIIEARELRRERDRNLLELSNEKTRTHTIVNSMSDGLIVTNCSGQVVLINPVALKMMRLNQQAVIGKTVDDLIHNDGLKNQISETLEKVQKSTNSTTMQVQTEDERFLHSSITPLLDENHNCLGTVTVLRDITEEKKVEKLKSEFVRLVAHELKAPLGAIDGYLNLILEGYISDTLQVDDMILKSRNKAKALLNLINDLLDLSRTEKTEITKTKTTIDIYTILQETVNFFENEAKEKQLDLQFECDKNLPAVQGIDEEVSRLFSNLISNAIKYTPEGGVVYVSAKKNDGYLAVSVQDTGIGISQEDQKNIFEEFYRSNNAVTRKISGTGLGLSIAKKIADNHNGYLELQSEEGKGSTFHVFLPVKKD